MRSLRTLMPRVLRAISQKRGSVTNSRKNFSPTQGTAEMGFTMLYCLNATTRNQRGR